MRLSVNMHVWRCSRCPSVGKRRGRHLRCSLGLRRLRSRATLCLRLLSRRAGRIAVSILSLASALDVPLGLVKDHSSDALKLFADRGHSSAMNVTIFVAKHLQEFGHRVHELKVGPCSSILRVLQDVGKQSNKCRYRVVHQKPFNHVSMRFFISDIRAELSTYQTQA